MIPEKDRSAFEHLYANIHSELPSGVDPVNVCIEMTMRAERAIFYDESPNRIGLALEVIGRAMDLGDVYDSKMKPFVFFLASAASASSCPQRLIDAVDDMHLHSVLLTSSWAAMDHPMRVLLVGLVRIVTLRARESEAVVAPRADVLAYVENAIKEGPRVPSVPGYIDLYP